LERFAGLRPNPQVARYLARAFVAGVPEPDALVTRGAETLGRDWRWLRPLATRYLARFAGQTRPRLRDVLDFLRDDVRFQDACRRHHRKLTVVQRIAGAAPMLPVSAAAHWGVPAIATVAELASWLRLSPEELAWFADLKGLERRARIPDRLLHYHYRIFAKPSGGLRLIEAPKERMKTLQRQILGGILDRIPAHRAVHGFVHGRGIRTFAEPHVGKPAVLRMDLRDFFPSVRRARVQSLFRTLGYPEPVADLLGGIVTTRTPRDVFRGVAHDDLDQLRRLYEQSHLPQGAPSSPALANGCCYRLDCRLAALARAAGAVYTRYADDLAFSGGDGFLRGSTRFAAHVGAVVLEQGLAVNFRKTRVMRQGVRQHLAGLVVNERVNVPRAEFDRLKAILTNCIRNGPEAENREGRPEFRAHLAGRVAFVASVNAERGARLRMLLERIVWE
jgi:RNA-directed DNA polymerase